ncbi:MAG TPA: MFS transporter [Steroidobacteraceae bacterium]|nr:MFS transporter [Steroidobacteraceae bacterium]
MAPYCRPVRDLLKNRPVLAWAMYDWANSAFATTVMAGFFPVFFQKFWSVDLTPTDTTSRLGYGNAVAGAVIAILAPILGAIADRGGRRKQFMFVWTLLGVVATGGLYLAAHGQWVVALSLFVLATIGFNGGIVFNDSLLLDVAETRELDRVSALGYSLGYLGGGLLFLANVLMVQHPSWFGLADAGQAVRVAFVTVAVWWLVFTIPVMRGVKEQQRGPHLPFGQAVVVGFKELKSTITHVRRYRTIVMFLLAYWFYIDGVNTIIKMAVNYGTALGLDTGKLLAALLVTQFVGFPAALLFGWLGDRIGAKRAILIGLLVYSGITVYAYFLDSETEFFVLAMAVGLVQGGVQSLSRSLFGRLVPEGKNAEFFGFYNMMGKFATVLGPLLIAVVAGVTHDERASIVSLVLLFLVGGALLWRVKLTPREA